jgi:hypothetical protein
MKKVETVFDHNITKKEWDGICGIDKDEYLRFAGESTANLDLAKLYYRRGDKEKATYYADKLPPNGRNDFWRTVTHP